MPTVDKTWTFAADNEGLADVGDSAISVVHDTAGNPAGSLEFTGAATGLTERARRATTGQTWQDWGVPSGGVVTSAQIISWDKQKYNSGGAAPTIAMRVVGSGGSTVHTAGDLVGATFTNAADGAWSSQGAGTSRAVDSGSQASTTDVRLEVQLTNNTIDAVFDMGIDNILLRMTYTTGAKSPPPSTARFPRSLAIR